MSGRRRYRPLTEDDSGVSDTIGYVLTFAVVSVSVVTASTIGFNQLGDFQQREEAKNAERAFRLIEQNFDQIQQSQAESRRSEISLTAGSLSPKNRSNSWMNVTVNVTGGQNFEKNVSMNALEYRLEETTIAFEGGAVFYQDDTQNSVLEDGPEMFCQKRGSDAGRAIVSVVQLQADFSKQFSGGTIGISARDNGTRLLYPENRTGVGNQSATSNVTVEVNSEYSEAWREHFVDDENGWEEIDEDTYRCTDSDGLNIYVRQSNLSLRFVR